MHHRPESQQVSGIRRSIAHAMESAEPSGPADALSSGEECDGDDQSRAGLELFDANFRLCGVFEKMNSQTTGLFPFDRHPTMFCGLANFRSGNPAAPSSLLASGCVRNFSSVPIGNNSKFFRSG
jgi:hypothetical protein